MNVSNLKDLKKLIHLCQSQGVRAIEVDGIKLELNELVKAPKRYKHIPEPSNSLSPNLDENISIPQMDIPTDELTEEEMLFYSAPTVQTSNPS